MGRFSMNMAILVALALAIPVGAGAVNPSAASPAPKTPALSRKTSPAVACVSKRVAVENQARPASCAPFAVANRMADCPERMIASLRPNLSDPSARQDILRDLQLALLLTDRQVKRMDEIIVSIVRQRDAEPQHFEMLTQQMSQELEGVLTDTQRVMTKEISLERLLSGPLMPGPSHSGFRKWQPHPHRKQPKLLPEMVGSLGIEEIAAVDASLSAVEESEE